MENNFFISKSSIGDFLHQATEFGVKTLYVGISTVTRTHYSSYTVQLSCWINDNGTVCPMIVQIESPDFHNGDRQEQHVCLNFVREIAARMKDMAAIFSFVIHEGFIRTSPVVIPVSTTTKIDDIQ